MKLKLFKIEVFDIFGKKINEYKVQAKNKTLAIKAVKHYAKNSHLEVSYKAS